MKRTKPTASMNNILLNISSVAKIISFTAGEVIEICPKGRRRVIFLKKGDVEIFRFLSIVREKDLWLDLLAIASSITSFLIHRDINLVNQDRFHVVMHYLKELYALPQDKNIAFTTTNYIVRRSGLSRSGVMAVLSELKKGKYIKIENGILVHMSDNIPDAF